MEINPEQQPIRIIKEEIVVIGKGARGKEELWHHNVVPQELCSHPSDLHTPLMPCDISSDCFTPESVKRNVNYSKIDYALRCHINGNETQGFIAKESKSV